MANNFGALGATLAYGASTTAVFKANSDPNAPDYLICNKSTTSWAAVKFTQNANDKMISPNSDGQTDLVIPIAPNTGAIFACLTQPAYIGVVLDSGTGVVTVTPGQGE